jgi:hypothetical protein
MKKSLLVLALASSFAMADEGMWMPQQLPEIRGPQSAVYR